MHIKIAEKLNIPYFSSLDGLRGIAILLVIISHALLNSSFKKYALGNIGVEIFFVLSGFLITTLLLKEKSKTGKVSFKNFYIRRVLRILPVAYLFLMTLLVLNKIFDLNISTGSFLASFFYTRNLHLNYVGDWYTAHFWTLAIEEQFYMIFPFLLIYSLKNYFRIIIFLIVAVPVLQYVGFKNIGIIYHNYCVHKLTFLIINLFGNGTTSILIGSLLSVLMNTGLLDVKTSKLNKYLSFGLLLSGIIFRTFCNDMLSNTYLTSTIFSCIIAVVIFLCIMTDDFLSRILKHKILISIGILSYSLYVWQQIFMYKQPWENSFKYSNSVWLNVIVLAIVSYMSYHFFEVKFLKIKNKFK